MPLPSSTAMQPYFVVDGVLVDEPLVPDLVVWSGGAVPAVPAGVFGVRVVPPLAPDGVLGEPMVLVVPEGTDPLSGVEPAVLPLIAPPVLPAPPLMAPPVLPVAVLPVVASLPVPVVAVLPVVDVVEGFDIVLSVFGVSLLLQAPSAARVAAIATHLIE